MNITNSILHQISEIQNISKNFWNADTIETIEMAGIILSQALSNDGKIITCGNGGSMADAMHFSEELTGKFRHTRKALPALALSDPCYLTCIANDFGFEQVFARGIEAYGQSQDVLLAISTSGNSRNVIAAGITALEKNIPVIALTGNDGGELGKLANIEIRVPYQGFSDRIQEIHIQIIHILIYIIEINLLNAH